MIGYFLLSTFYLLPSTFYLLPSTFYLLPSAFCLLPFLFSLLPWKARLTGYAGWPSFFFFAGRSIEQVLTCFPYQPENSFSGPLHHHLQAIGLPNPIRLL